MEVIRYLAVFLCWPITNPLIEEGLLTDNGCDIFPVPAIVFNTDAAELTSLDKGAPPSNNVLQSSGHRNTPSLCSSSAERGSSMAGLKEQRAGLPHGSC